MAPRKTPGVTVRVNDDGSRTYRIRWRRGGGSGPQDSHTYSRLAEATDALAKIKANGNVCDCPIHSPEAARLPAVSLGLMPGSERDEPTFADAVREHAAILTGVGANYRERYERDLLRHFAHLADRTLSEIDAATVKKWIRGCEEGSWPWLARRVPGTQNEYIPTPLSPVTTRRLLVQAGAIYRDRGLSPNPFAGHRVGRRDADRHESMKVLTRAEWMLIRDALTPGVPRDFCTVLITTGLRFGEATALQVGDVNLDMNELRVRRAWKAGGELGPPKSQRSRRTVDFGPRTADALAPHVKDKQSTDWVFTAPRGGPLRASNFTHREWFPALDRAQVAGLTRRPRLHDLRHSAVSYMLMAGVPIFEVSRRVGHQTASLTTDLYGHLVPGGSGRAVDAIEAALE